MVTGEGLLMAETASSFNMGDRENMTIQNLFDIVEQMYTILAEAVNSKPDLYERNEDGQTDEAFLTNGSININKSTNKVEILTNHVNPTTVTWTKIS